MSKPKVNMKKVIADLNRFKKQLAKDRDELRDFQDEINMLEECSTMALEDIESAIEKLSELV